jgi:hypothetical protein
MLGMAKEKGFGVTRPATPRLAKIAAVSVCSGLTVVLSELRRDRKGSDRHAREHRRQMADPQELADRYGLPVKTPAEWASKGTGPRCAKFGRHVRYLLSGVLDWERKQFTEDKRHPA